ncbi:hypothetical protein D3C87_1706390 [compost metagenome]
MKLGNEKELLPRRNAMEVQLFMLILTRLKYMRYRTRSYTTMVIRFRHIRYILIQIAQHLISWIKY